MTKDDIKKALEICNPVHYTCNGCSYKGMEDCIVILKTDARNLIIEQEKDIEWLKEVIKNYKEVLCETTRRKDEAIKLNDKLIEEYEIKVKQAKIDVLNKLKEKIFHCLGIENIQQASGLSLLGSLVPYDIVIDNIDELLEERKND